jgi:hypothetical protein
MKNIEKKTSVKPCLDLRKFMLRFGVIILAGILFLKFLFFPLMEVITSQNILLVSEKIKKFNATEVNILYNEGDLFDIQLAMEIYLPQNKKLIVEQVNSNLRGEIKIRQIGGYRLFSYNSDGSRSPYLPKYILEDYAHLKVDNLLDIIGNYNSIYSFIETFDDIESQKYKNINKINIGPWSANIFNIKIYNLKDKQGVFFKKKVDNV